MSQSSKSLQYGHTPGLFQSSANRQGFSLFFLCFVSPTMMPGYFTHQADGIIPCAYVNKNSLGHHCNWGASISCFSHDCSPSVKETPITTLPSWSKTEQKSQPTHLHTALSQLLSNLQNSVVLTSALATCHFIEAAPFTFQFLQSSSNNPCPAPRNDYSISQQTSHLQVA